MEMESAESGSTEVTGQLKLRSRGQGWSTSSFRAHILTLLQERDNRESRGFSELFHNHERLFEQWSTLRSENLRLSLAVERGHSDKGGGGCSEEREKQLEQKILKLQEEVTELHRGRGENASQVLALSAKLTEREAELDLNRTAAATAVAKNADLEDQVKFLQSCLQEREATNDVLRDEHQALHLAYTSLEEKHRWLTRENQELLQRYIEVKAKHADIMNQENENFVKQKQAQVRKELEEAAAEMKMVVMPGGNSPPKNFVSPCDINLLSSLGMPCTIPSTPSKPFEAHESEVTAVRWNPNGKHFATAGQDRKVKIWEPGKTDTPELRATLTGSGGSILCLDFDSSGSYLLAASHDFACRIWTLDDGRLRHTLTGHTAKVNAARFMADGSRVVSGGYDRTLKVWDLKSRACISTKFAGSSCHDLVSLPDTNSVISCHYDKRIRFWDLRTDSPSQEVTLADKVTSLDISHNQHYLLASVRDDSLCVLDLRMNTVMAQYSADGFKVSSDICRAVFSPDAQWAACGSLDGSIYFWNVMEHRLEMVLKEHSSAVGSIHWHPRGISLVSGDRTKKVVVWAP